jgi:O-acetyl-ADP-ribose deacetylase (regulator of RNase III)
MIRASHRRNMASGDVRAADACAQKFCGNQWQRGTTPTDLEWWVSPMISEFLNGWVLVSSGDITAMDVDAVVNAANASLLGGGGVDGAIHRAGGPTILAACREIRRTRYPDGLPTGEAVIATGGALKARFVIHTVGPIWEHDPDADLLLASCYRNSMALAQTQKLREIAFPAISTGAYGFPKPRAAAIAAQAITESMATASSLTRVQLVFFSVADADLFVRHQRFPRD